MAIFISGMTCPLCGQPMTDGAEVSGYPAFISNKRDPLYLFSDGVFHRRCLEAHPSASILEQRYEAWRTANRPPARICRISGKLITDPDDYLGVGFLVESPSHELYPFNWAHFSRHELKGWVHRDELRAAVERLAQSTEWEGDSLKWLLANLAASPTPNLPPSSPRG